MDTSAPNRWARHGLAAAARTALATLAGLVVWTVLPVILGWQPSVVMSGSMEPVIRVGDIVLTRTVPVDRLQPGHVLLVADPSRPGERVLHRYDRQDDDGSFVLRGDANPRADATPVHAEDVLGVGVLRVPTVGLPYVWTVEGRYLPVGLTALGLLVLAALSPIRERYDDAVHAPADGLAPPAREPTVGAVPAVVVASVLLAAGGIAAAATTPVAATFTDTAPMTATFATGTWTDPVAPVGE